MNTGLLDIQAVRRHFRFPAAGRVVTNNAASTQPPDDLLALYAELSAGAGWRARRLEVRLDGHNLTDRRDPVAESELGDAQYYRLPARRFEVTARLRF